jgi:hypothetical protein
VKCKEQGASARPHIIIYTSAPGSTPPYITSVYQRTMGTQRGSGAPSLPPAPAGWLASHAPAMPCLRSCAAAVAWVSLLAVPVHAASNVTVSLWGKPEAECQGQPDVVHSYEADHCTYGRLFALPTNSSDDGPGDDDAEWFRIRCEGFLTVEVFKYIYEDKDCQGGYLRQPMEEPGRCLVVVDGDAPQQQFVADAVISCGPHARQWPVSGMTLMAVGVVAVCLCGHCHARRSGRGFNRNHRRTTRSVSGESIYDPTTFRPGYSSSPAATAGGAAAASSPLSRGGLAASQQANQGRNAADVLPPACLAIIEEAGGAQLNLQQITQQVPLAPYICRLHAAQIG